MNKKIAPDGYSTVCPYLMVESVEKELDFLQTVFDAEIIEQLHKPEGEVMHGEARIGDSVIMMGKSRSDWPAKESANYVYVENVDEVFDRAIKYGAASMMRPANQFYGNREAGFKDLQGNQWWIAAQIEKVSVEEMEKRLAERGKK